MLTKIVSGILILLVVVIGGFVVYVQETLFPHDGYRFIGTLLVPDKLGTY